MRGFVRRDDPRGKHWKYHIPLELRMHGPESPHARLCVAPTVWQCVVSTTDSDALYIYQLECIEAYPPAPDHKVGDAYLTDEHWIDDEVISQNGGIIVTKVVGVIPKVEVFLIRFRLGNWLSERGHQPIVVDESQHVWVVDSSHSPPAWHLRDDIAPLPDDDYEPSPLEPPSGNYLSWGESD
jgi:hypothetical protein